MKIELRPLRIPDAVPLAKLANNEKVSRYLRDRFPAPYEPEHALSFIQCCHANEEDGMAMVRAVTAEGKLVGIVECVFHIDVDSRNGDVGYWLGEPYWHKGIAREALRQFTDLIFDAASRNLEAERQHLAAKHGLYEGGGKRGLCAGSGFAPGGV